MTPQHTRSEMVVEIIRQLHELGCFVTNAAPANERALRFEVETERLEATLEKLAMREWHVKPVGAGRRVYPEGNAALVKPVAIYELELPPRDDAPASPTTGPGGEIKPITSKQICDDAEYRLMLSGFRGLKR